MQESGPWFDICIVCALAVEARAVIDEFSTHCGVSFSSAFTRANRYQYRYTTIRNNSGEPLTVLVIWLSGMGSEHTGLDLKSLLQEFRPRFAAMTGICAGDRDRVALGDLIVAESAFQYHEGKASAAAGGQMTHLLETETAASTRQVIQYVRGFDSWKQPLREVKAARLDRVLEPDEEPHLHIGQMASGMAVRQDNPFPWLREQYGRKTVALDMEAGAFYGVFGAVSDIHALVVKGVCDYADREKHDDYQDYAARASALYLLLFLREYVSEETMPRRNEAELFGQLPTETSRFFQNAGFRLTILDDSVNFLCEPVTPKWQKLLNRVSYVRIFTGQSLDGDDVLDIREAARSLDRAISVALVVVDKPIADNAWLQIAVLRAKNFNVIPVPSTLFFESRALSKTTAPELRLDRHLERFLGRGADPYNIQRPVFDVLNFFGRESLARDLLEEMTAGQPIGLFGLRRIGKSSLMRYLQGLMPYPTACIDLQAGAEPVGLLERILHAWSNDAQVRFDVDLGLSDIRLSPTGVTEEFVKIVQVLLDKLALSRPDARLAIFLDEIELIVPPRSAVGPVLETSLSLMRTLRGLVQEDGRILLMVAGLDPAINRISRWGKEQEQNPFFLSLQESYLPPLLEPDCTQMIRNIGTQAGLSYSDEAAMYVAQMSGGHPALARQLCSLTYRQRDRQPGEVTLSAVQRASERFLLDPKYAASINDTGLWSEVTHDKIWGEQVAQINQAILSMLAKSVDPVAESSIISGPDAATRQSALFALRELHVIRPVEEPTESADPHYIITFGLLRTWIRRIKLGLEW